MTSLTVPASAGDLTGICRSDVGGFFFLIFENGATDSVYRVHEGDTTPELIFEITRS